MVNSKLIVCSVVGKTLVTPTAMRVHAWSVESLEDNLRRERRQNRVPFLPVAAFRSDPDLVKELLGVPALPVTLRIEHAVRFFTYAPVERCAQGPVGGHISRLPDYGFTLLMEWVLACDQFSSLVGT